MAHLLFLLVYTVKPCYAALGITLYTSAQYHMSLTCNLPT